MESGNLSKLTGRDLFNFRPELMLGDDAEADDMTYEREDSDEEGEGGAEGGENAPTKTTVKEIDLDEFAFDMETVDASDLPEGNADNTDASGTSSDATGAAAAAEAADAAIDPSPHFSKILNGLHELGAVGGADPTAETDSSTREEAGASAAAEAAAPDIDIDEALFDPDDLDDLDEELETLDIDS